MVNIAEDLLISERDVQTSQQGKKRTRLGGGVSLLYELRTPVSSRKAGGYLLEVQLGVVLMLRWGKEASMQGKYLSARFQLCHTKISM